MSVSSVIAGLQAIHRGIAGVAAAPTAMPGSLNTAVQPLVLVWPGQARWSLQALGYYRQERVYEVRCYVQPVGQDRAGPENGYSNTVALLQRFGEAYLADPSLGGLVDGLVELSDSGVLGGGPEMTVGGISYWGFVYRVTVVEKTS